MEIPSKSLVTYFHLKAVQTWDQASIWNYLTTLKNNWCSGLTNNRLSSLEETSEDILREFHNVSPTIPRWIAIFSLLSFLELRSWWRCGLLIKIQPDFSRFPQSLQATQRKNTFCPKKVFSWSCFAFIFFLNLWLDRPC